MAFRLPFRLATLAALVTASLAPAPAAAQDTPNDAPQNAIAEPPFSETLLQSLRTNANREEYIAQTLRPLRQLDEDQNGLDERDVERQQATERARARASAAQRILSVDFNADLKVERAEMLEYLPGDMARRESAADRLFRRYDKDGDGVITLEEALAVEPRQRRRANANIVPELLALDPNGDGRITALELTGIAGAVFDYFDVDRSGTLSREETEAVRAERELAREVRQRREAGCFFKPPSAKARVIAFAPYGGQTISSVYVGSPNIETGLIDVAVEPGSQPLFLVLRTYDSVVWRFTGATDRIERVVAGSYETGNREVEYERGSTSAIGVMGIAKDRVRITNQNCLPDYSDQREIDAGVPQEAFAALFGRKPDVIERQNPIGRLSVPSLQSARVKSSESPGVMDGFDPEIWKDAIHFHAGGLAMIETGDVVAAEPVGDYDVLPNKFGLAKLVASGHLSFEGDAFYKRKFTLLKPIARWPASMNGSLSTAFVKPEGVPMPAGELGHSCVLSVEQGAKANWERLCQEAMMGGIPRAVEIQPTKLRR
ncbi:MAG: hypothetical protein AAF650_06270 [Pseudomonadota bacterium]